MKGWYLYYVEHLFEIYSSLLKTASETSKIQILGCISIHHADEDGVMEGGVCYTTLLEDKKASLLESSWESSQPTVYPA